LASVFWGLGRGKWEKAIKSRVSGIGNGIALLIDQEKNGDLN
jgi:hypothetical protein